jgi:iron complex transport system substrate-binding protein
MKITIFFHYFFIMILFSLSSFANASADSPLLTVSDDQGNLVTLHAPAKRIISLAPDITETLFAIGAGHLIVATVDSSDYPKEVQKISRIGSYTGLDLERIISLHPDLIINFGHSFARQLAVLKKWGIPIYITDPHRLEDIPLTMKNLAELTGMERKGKEEAQHFLQGLAKLRQQYATKPALSVYYQIGTYSLITINKKSWINQAITLCGGQNVFADLKTLAPHIDWEALLKANPNVILTDAKIPSWKNIWKKWPELTAVKNNYLYAIDPDVIDRASPRLLTGVAEICQSLQKVRDRSLAS